MTANLVKFTTQTYQHLLKQDKMLTVIDFIKECQLPVESFQIQEYWNVWENPAQFMIVNKDLLEWLGYKGPLKEQRRNLLDIMKKNLHDDEFKIFTGGQLPTETIVGINEGNSNRIIAITYPGLKKLSMMISTDRGSAIREAYIIRELCFSLYIKYQADFRVLEQKKLTEEQKKLTEEQKKIVQTQASNILKLKVRNEKLKMRRHHPELDAGFCFYLHHNGEIPAKDRFKGGKTNDIGQVLKAARRNSPYTLLDFIIYLDESTYGIIESAIKLRFIDQRRPRSHEIITASLQEIIDAAILICDSMKVKYSLGNQAQIDAYNEFIIQETSANEADLGTEADDEKIEMEEKDESNLHEENDEKIPEPSITNNNTTNNITNNITITLPANSPDNISLEEALSMFRELENMTSAELKRHLEKYSQPVGRPKENQQRNLKTFLIQILQKYGQAPNIPEPPKEERTRYPPAMDGFRSCLTCNKHLHITKFSPKAYGTNGRDGTCYDCRHQARLARREAKAAK